MIKTTPYDMQKRYDVRMLLRLSFDDERDHEPNELNSSPILLTAIEEATGNVIAAISVAKMYTPEQLDQLVPESVQLFKRIVCELALCFLYSRRGAESRESVSDLFTMAEEYLDRLRKGERLFAIQGSDVKEQAGIATLVEPQAIQLRQLNGITQRVSVYFGDVGHRLHHRRYGE